MSVSNKSGSKFLFYPRSYNKRGEVNMHSMIGMTESGQLINVKLRLPEKHANKPTSPSIVEFARNDFRAKMVCIASDDNGPSNPEGILLLSGCQKEGEDRSKNLEVYTAQWADVIASDSQSPRYFSGLSRMVIQPYSNEVIKLRALLDRAQKAGDNEKAEQIQAKIDDPVNWSFPVILYYPQETEEFTPDQVDELILAGAKMVDRISEKGPTGGVAIRAVTSQGHVIEESFSELYARYIVTETRIQTGRELMQVIVEDWEWMSKEGITIEIFPIGKINSGPVANKMYSKEANYNFIERYFYENDKPRVCHGIIRISYNEDAHLTLLSKYFALSKPIGDPARLDSNGGLTRVFDGEDVKLAQFIEHDNAIVPRLDGIEPMSNYQARAMWLMSDQINYKHFMNQVEAANPVERLKGAISQAEAPAVEKPESSQEATTPAIDQGTVPEDRIPSPTDDVMDEIEISFDEPDPVDGDTDFDQRLTENPEGPEGDSEQTGAMTPVSDTKIDPDPAWPSENDKNGYDQSEPEAVVSDDVDQGDSISEGNTDYETSSGSGASAEISSPSTPSPSNTPAEPETNPVSGVGAFLRRKK